MEKSVIIIGAGIAGLSAGCYSQMNAYRPNLYTKRYFVQASNLRHPEKRHKRLVLERWSVLQVV